MSNEKKIELLEEMLDLDAGTLKPEMVLADMEEWDSIARLSFIVLMDDEFGRTVQGGTIKEQKTVADLLALMEADG